MSEMGTAMIGTGEAMGERRERRAAEAAIANPLLATAISSPKRFVREGPMRSLRRRPTD
jgi:cell division GTPase FtsZ